MCFFCLRWGAFGSQPCVPSCLCEVTPRRGEASRSGPGVLNSTGRRNTRALRPMGRLAQSWYIRWRKGLLWHRVSPEAFATTRHPSPNTLDLLAPLLTLWSKREDRVPLNERSMVMRPCFSAHHCQTFPSSGGESEHRCSLLRTTVKSDHAPKRPVRIVRRRDGCLMNVTRGVVCAVRTSVLVMKGGWNLCNQVRHCLQADRHLKSDQPVSTSGWA